MELTFLFVGEDGPSLFLLGGWGFGSEEAEAKGLDLFQRVVRIMVRCVFTKE